MKHEFYDVDDFKDDPYFESPLATMVIEGGLSICKKCHLIEGSLTTDCPGKPVHDSHGDLVYKGKIDFRDGHWVEECSPYSPEYWRREAAFQQK